LTHAKYAKYAKYARYAKYAKYANVSQDTQLASICHKFGGLNPSVKYISQLGVLFPINGKS